MSKSGTTIQFKYGYNGIRTQKVVNSTTTDYTYHGTLLTHLKQGSNNLHFFYDAQSRPAMVDLGGTKYTYLHNLQGDIVGLLDSAGNLVVEYKYDAWGKPVSVRTLTTAYDTLANLNPFRYRGYIWDEETGWYYLRSRYYNPEWGRFINADVLLGKTGGLLSHNGFAYCGNNSILFLDSNGYESALVYLNYYIGCTDNDNGHMDVSIVYGDYIRTFSFGKGEVFSGGAVGIVSVRRGITYAEEYNAVEHPGKPLRRLAQDVIRVDKQQVVTGLSLYFQNYTGEIIDKNENTIYYRGKGESLFYYRYTDAIGITNGAKKTDPGYGGNCVENSAILLLCIGIPFLYDYYADKTPDDIEKVSVGYIYNYFHTTGGCGE